MKVKIIYAFLIIVLYSCEAKKLYDTKPIAEEIVAEVMGTSGNIYFTTEKAAGVSDNKYFVEFNINQCGLVEKLNTEKSIVASYIASQLYRRLDPEIVEKNYGFNIIFDGEQDPLNMKKYFFNKQELKKAWKSFDNIDKYLNLISNGDMESSKTLIDSSFFSLNIDSLSKVVKTEIGSAILKTMHTYQPYEFSNDEESPKISCFAIGTIVIRKDSSQTFIEFLSPMNQAQNKIINLDVHQ